jgi:transcriptional regulator with XRE-family HTH domain
VSERVSGMEGGMPSLADRVDQLFRTLRPPGSKDREYSYEEVAKAVADGGGPTISATYIYMLRKGIRDNPTKKHLEALAEFFRVSPAYFFDDDTGRQVHAELALLAALRDADVAGVALRASGLSAGSLDAIRTMITQARRLEGLPEAAVDELPGGPD